MQLTSAAPAVRRLGREGREGRESEEERFTAFVAARWGALVRTAYLLTGDHHEAEDLVQTTLAKVYPHWRRIGEDEASRYLRRALVNNNRSRVRRRRVIHQLTWFLPDTPAPVSAEQDRDALVAALAALSERQRAVVVLRYWEDLSVEEVAHELGCSTGTVKSQASRALARLRTDPNLAEHPVDLLGVPR